MSSLYSLRFFFFCFYALCVGCCLFLGSFGQNYFIWVAPPFIALGDFLFRRWSLRTLTFLTLGLFIGVLVGKTFSLIVTTLMGAFVPHSVLETIKALVVLFGLYLGVVMTLRNADEIHLSIPFVRLTALSRKKKEFIADLSVLSDTRIIDLASFGFLDQRLVIPRFLLKEMGSQAEASDDSLKGRAKRVLEVVKKLEQLPHLEMRVSEVDCPEASDSIGKLVHMARFLEGIILTADITRVQIASIEDVRVVNIHALANALKPLTQAGERIKIKLQRQGKEPGQGVGYLEDGTMVVVNGGGDFIGETIEAVVVSVKHTTSGRMIFCNALEEQSPYANVYDTAVR